MKYASGVLMRACMTMSSALASAELLAGVHFFEKVVAHGLHPGGRRCGGGTVAPNWDAASLAYARGQGPLAYARGWEGSSVNAYDHESHGRRRLRADPRPQLRDIPRGPSLR